MRSMNTFVFALDDPLQIWQRVERGTNISHHKSIFKKSIQGLEVYAGARQTNQYHLIINTLL